MRLLLFGGAFNPPHNGHWAAAQRFSEALQPDLLLIMPTGTPMHKPMPPLSPTPEQRLALCELTFGGLPKVQICDWEIRQECASYTVNTVRRLREQYAGATITVGIGGDMLLALHQWAEIDALCGLARFAVLSRGDGDVTALHRQAAYMRSTFGAEIDILPHEPIVVGSFGLRQALRRGDACPQLSRVMDYIDTHRLYRSEALPLPLDEIRQLVEKQLPPKRFRHTLNTADTAVALAKRWGADPDEAARAGLWHDYTKPMGREERLQVCQQYGIMVNLTEKMSKSGVHARTAAALAFDRYGESRAVASAIAAHTTGAVGMDTLAKCLYLADKIEPSRNYPAVTTLRVLAHEDLDKALLATFNDALLHLLNDDEAIVCQGIDARNDLLRRMNEPRQPQ